MGTVGGLGFDGGIPPRVVVDHGIGGGEVEADAASLEADEEHRHVALLELPHQIGAGSGWGVAGQSEIFRAALVQRLLDQCQHLGELGEHQYAPAFIAQAVEQFQQCVELGRFLHLAGRVEFDQARIATGLAQLEQGVDHHDARLPEATLGDGFAHPLVLCQTQGFVELALAAGQFQRMHDLGFGRQFGQHVFLASAQQQRGDAPAEAELAVGIAMFFDRRAVGAGEAGFRTEQARFHRIELRPKFPQMVFQRRTGHGQAATRGDLAHHLRCLAAGILDGLSFVHHQQRELLLAEVVAVTRQQRVGGDDQVRFGDGFIARCAVGTVQHQHVQIGCEACGFIAPVADQAGGCDHECR